VYEIFSLVTGEKYVGSSSCCLHRRLTHFNALKRGKHGNKNLQNLANTHGIDSLEFRQRLCCREEDLILMEQCLIDAEKPSLNIFKIAGSGKELTHSQSTRALISKTKIGRARPENMKVRISKKLSKLNEVQVADVFSMHKAGFLRKEIALKHGVNASTITRILSGDSYIWAS